MTTKVLLTFVGLLSAWMCFAQAPIIICDTDGEISQVDLPNSCSKNIIVDVGISLSDITLHPNGKMYGTRFSQGTLVEVNLTQNNQFTTIIDFGNANPVGMTAAANGKIYVTEGGATSRLFEVDVTNNTFIVKGVLANGSAGDLSWSNGQLYNASADNKLVRVDIDNPANSVVIGQFNTGGSETIFSLVTAYITCDSSITYGISNQTNQYYIIDLNNAGLTTLCTGSGARIFGATSTDEFSASDTCSITLDLDNNNSSGATGYDFFSNFECNNSAANIADIDVQIESVNTIDSVVVRLTGGILDGANEFLQLGNTPNISANNNSIKISAVNNGSASLTDFENFINTLTYRNTANPISSGDRTVEVVAYGNNGTSNVATATISLTESVNAGNDTDITLCSDDSPVNLFNGLQGADAGGTWSPSFTSGTNIFDPQSDNEGTYFYIVSNSCNTDSATVEVTINEAVTAGLNGSITLCTSDDAVDLFSILGGSPTPGGSWSPSLNSGTGLFDPEVDTEGQYTYSVTGCNSDSATIEVVVNDFPNAGTNGSLNLCTSDAPVNLINSLGNNPSSNGTWSPGLSSGGNIFDPSEDASGTYIYTVTGCDTSTSAQVTVSIGEAPDAGDNGSLAICSSSDPFNLINALDGNPNSGGTWSPTLSGGNNLFDPMVDVSGTYTYTVTGCGTETTAQVLVSVTQSPNAGTNGSINVLNTDDAFNLINVLNNNPDNGGVWSPELNSGSNIFDPSIDPAGSYTYIVSNNCGIDSSIATVTIEEINNDSCFFESLFVPNAFTPNGDGLNDELLVRYAGNYDTYIFRIYNRWGGLVFETDDINNGWNGFFEGKLQSTDVFGYFLELKCGDQVKQLKGNITILR